MIKPEIIALLKTGSFCVALTKWEKSLTFTIVQTKINPSRGAVRKKLLIISIIILCIGIYLNIYSCYQCENIIQRSIKSENFGGQKTILYLIKTVNSFCRSCSDYETLKESGSYIIFYVENDFTDNDIDNFRDAFQINKSDRVEGF